MSTRRTFFRQLGSLAAVAAVAPLELVKATTPKITHEWVSTPLIQRKRINPCFSGEMLHLFDIPKGHVVTDAFMDITMIEPDGSLLVSCTSTNPQ